MTTVNFAELVQKAGDAAATTNYEPLPEGDYELKVVEASATTTSTGKLMFKLTNEVQGGPHAKRRVWDQWVVSTDNETAMNIFFGKAASVGLSKEFWLANPSPAQVEQALNGRSFRGRVAVRTYQGKQGNEIQRYSPSQLGAAVASSAAPVAAAAPAPAPAPAPAAPIAASADTPF